MLIKCIDGFTRQFGAPADWDGKDMSCGVLPVLDVETGEGNFMFSAWEPTPPELEALKKGANIILGVRGMVHPVVSLQVAADAEAKHPDDVAVDQFAEAMKAKLADARAKGRSGWQDCDPAELCYMLREHVEKGDPRDVANFCMFLWSLGKPIDNEAPSLHDVSFFKWLEDAHRNGCKFNKWDMEDAYRAGERSARASASPAVAQPVADEREDPIRELIALHANELEGNDYAYFELARHRRTDWMAWICTNVIDSDPNRKVLAKGQGDTPEEACAAAVADYRARAALCQPAEEGDKA